jgi:hypothetical protein
MAWLILLREDQFYVVLPHWPKKECIQKGVPVVGEVPFTAELTGAAERPMPVTTTGARFATATLRGATLSFTLAYRNLPTVATFAHIHGPAVSTNTAGVLINLALYHQGPLARKVCSWARYCSPWPWWERCTTAISTSTTRLKLP